MLASEHAPLLPAKVTGLTCERPEPVTKPTMGAAYTTTQVAVGLVVVTAAAVIAVAVVVIVGVGGVGGASVVAPAADVVVIGARTHCALLRVVKPSAHCTHCDTLYMAQ